MPKKHLDFLSQSVKRVAKTVVEADLQKREGSGLSFMKDIRKLAEILVPSCILNSFRRADKKHIVITGSRGVGKSTLLRALFPDAGFGITTFAETRKAVYLKDIFTGKIAVIGEYDASSEGECRKMKPCTDGFLTLGIPSLNACIEDVNELCVIDEIGYLEEACPLYMDKLSELFDKKRVAAVVRHDSAYLKKLQLREDVFFIDLDTLFDGIGCVVMASGEGKRFGANKLLANFKGSPIIKNALDIASLFDKSVAVTRSVDTAQFCEKSGVRCILHSLPYRSDTVKIGLGAHDSVAACIFLQGDQVLLKKETVLSLVLAWRNCPDKIWRVSYNGQEASPVIFPEEFFDSLLNLSDGEGGGAVIKRNRDKVRFIDALCEYEISDVDTPEDLARLEKIHC